MYCVDILAVRVLVQRQLETCRDLCLSIICVQSFRMPVSACIVEIDGMVSREDLAPVGRKVTRGKREVNARVAFNLKST